MAEKQEIYLGNPNLKRANVNTNFTPDQVQEFIKCSQDPVYFIRNYIKIVNLDQGIVGFDLYDFQEDMVNRFHEHRFNIAKLPRQSGKSTVVTAYLLWYAIFNDNVNIAILANKAATAREMLGVAYNFLMRIFLNGSNKVLSTGTGEAWNWKMEVKSLLQVLVLVLLGACPLTLYFWTNSPLFRRILLTSFSVLSILLYLLVSQLKLLSYLPLKG